MRSAGSVPVQPLLHSLPGVPFAGPSSHCSSHSTVPLPHASTRQPAEQPSQEVVLASSHCSNVSIVPLPQIAGFG